MQGPRYMVQVLLGEQVEVDWVALYSRLRGWRPDVQLLRVDPDVAFAIPTADLPLVANVFAAEPDRYADLLNDALEWSQAWEEPWAQTAERCRASLVVSVVAQRPIHYASLLLAFLAVFDAILFSLDEDVRAGAVLHWIPAKQLMTFERYCQLRTEQGPCGPAVNVRIANATGRPGELLADTVGLSELGLPDLQTVFHHDRDPAEVASRLRRLVGNLFVGARLDCTWIEDVSLAPPARDTLTLMLD
jgi:hypothetical protein